MEFFGLARGYGLAFGLLMMAVYHLGRAIATQQRRHLVLFHMAAILASLSSFALLGCHVAGILGFYLASGFLLRGSWSKRNIIRATKVNALMVLLAMVVLWEPVRRVRAENALDFGSKLDFYSSTVNTWTSSFFPAHPLLGWQLPFFQMLYTVLTIAVLIVLFRKGSRADEGTRRSLVDLMVVACTFLFTCIGLELQHHLLGVDRLVGRFALFLVPLITLLFILFLQQLMTRSSRVVILTLCASLSLLTSFQFFRTMTIYHSREWQYDMQTKEAFNVLIEHHVKHHSPIGRPVQLGVDWLFAPAMNYYRQSRNANWIMHMEHNGPQPTDEYRYLFAYDLHGAIGFTPIAYFSASGTVLLKRTDNEHPINRQP
jgi:hypothetical protein